MQKTLSVFGYAAAIATVLAMFLLPMFFLNKITTVIGHLGLHIDNAYSGGQVAFEIKQPSYHIDVYRPTFPGIITPSHTGFVQLVIAPRSGITPDFTAAIDYNGDGTVDFDLKITDCCHDGIKPHITVIPHTSTVIAVTDKITSTEQPTVVAELVKDSLYVRVPLKQID